MTLSPAGVAMFLAGWLRRQVCEPVRSGRRQSRLHLELLEDRLVPTLAGNQVFPLDNPWNERVDSAPVAANSATLVSSIGASSVVHPDFGAAIWDGGNMGIPYNVVSGTQPKINVVIDGYPDESDLLP